MTASSSRQSNTKYLSDVPGRGKKVGHLLLAGDTVFAHPGAKRAGVEAKEQRCSVFPLDSPTGCLEHLADAQIPAKSL